MTDAIAILKEAARGLKQALEAKGYTSPEVVFSVRSTGAPPVAICYATDRHYVVGYGNTVEELAGDALDRIESDIRPAVDPRLAAWFEEAA